MQNWLNNFKTRLRIYIFAGLILFFCLGVFIFWMSRKTSKSVTNQKTPDVVLPTIINGDLVLPSQVTSQDTSLPKVVTNARLGVNSANLVAIFDQGKLSGIRIVGETTNVGDSFVSNVSPVVRFYDADGKSVGQKIASFTQSFTFHDIAPKDKTLYDVTVNSPPQSDKVEIFFNTTSSSDSAIFEPLKIASRSVETKSTQTNQSTSASDSAATPAATPAANSVDYYIATGKILNPFDFNVSDVVVYAWAKNDEDKVFAVGQTDYKNDLISPGQSVDFSIIILPLQNGQKMAAYEIAAWGKEYKLNF